ncbi:citrate transporter (plasmid) [Pandoraea faecigallinarum]|uniref:Citrate transporter n=1 Tax=Pandoraea faecigallinarum TaxID=656179 RepID=A0A0H3X3H7_9BURK|nr:SLC13 family permease [Pandoraea faecigallinarum]AKM33326.1 citrate transporter [Pandoraea faecigallinarum]
MPSDLLLTFGLLCSALVMFIVGRPRADAVALIMIVMLPALGIVSLPQALAGFSNPNVLLIATLFVIGDGLVRAGVAHRLGEYLVRRGAANESRLVALLMGIVGMLGAIMSPSAVVVIFLPIVLNIARKSNIAYSRLVMPIGVAAMTSGMLTLATSSNLVANSALIYRGHEGVSFFALSCVGGPILIAAIAYMLVTRRSLSGKKVSSPQPRPTMQAWVERYSLAGRAFRLGVGSDSPLVGQTLGTFDLDYGDGGAHVVAVERYVGMGELVMLGTAQTTIAADDVLLLDADAAAFNVGSFCAHYGLSELPMSGAYFMDQTHDVGMAEVIVPPDSRLIGVLASKSVLQRHGVTVVGLRRRRGPIKQGLRTVRLKVGDTLLVVGTWNSIFAMQSVERDIVCLAMPVESETLVPVPHKSLQALGCLALTVILMLTPGVPTALAGLVGCLLMGLFGCVTLDSAYRAINWRSIILIVGMLPFAIALQHTGGVDLVVNTLVQVTSQWGPRSMVAAVFALTLGVGMVIASTPTVVLMAPVAVTMAEHMGWSPYPFAITVAIASSASYMSPIATPVNALVSSAGNYKLWDFIRIGTPMAVIAGVITVALVPIFWPM